MFDYLEWRGDLDFTQDKLNEVDNLVFSVLSYLNFEDIVDFQIKEQKICILKAAEYFKGKKLKSPAFYGNPFFTQMPDFLQRAAQTRRFGNVEISCYVSELDHENSNQFSAIVFSMDSKHHYIGFRGTDDTIAGWKEDFQMSFMDAVPAQKQAVNYVNTIIPGFEGEFYLGGHSKGGNLAVYAAAHAKKEIKERIISVFNNDGPGFQIEIVQSEEYQSILHKINTFVPKSSMVGLLMEHGEEYQVVSSSGMGIMQHKALNWEVLGPKFVYESELTKNSRSFDTALRSWLSLLSMEEREYFVEALFEIIQGTGALTFSELSAEKLNAIDAMVKSYKNMDSSTQILLKNTIDAFFKESQKVLKKSIGDNFDSLFSGKMFSKLSNRSK
ncbi:MAG: DUF2974 domain-containing protein [Solirubrobacterales bacterium]